MDQSEFPPDGYSSIVAWNPVIVSSNTVAIFSVYVLDITLVSDTSLRFFGGGILWNCVVQKLMIYLL